MKITTEYDYEQHACNVRIEETDENRTTEEKFIALKESLMYTNAAIIKCMEALLASSGGKPGNAN